MPHSKVLKLFLSVQGLDKRTEVKDIELDTDGIIGDKFYAKDPQRLILIASMHSYDLAKREGIELQYGDLGENILLNDNIYHLQAGDTLQIGAVTLQITQNGTLCKGLSKLDNRLPKLLKTDRGIFAKAVKPGSVKVGDTVTYPS